MNRTFRVVKTGQVLAHVPLPKPTNLARSSNNSALSLGDCPWSQLSTKSNGEVRIVLYQVLFSRRVPWRGVNRPSRGLQAGTGSLVLGSGSKDQNVGVMR